MMKFKLQGQGGEIGAPKKNKKDIVLRGWLKIIQNYRGSNEVVFVS